MNILESIKNKIVDEEDLLEYITSNDIEIALAVAESELATAEILDIASLDKDKTIRLAALNNPNIGYKTVLRLLNDRDAGIAELAHKKLEDFCNEKIL